MAAKGEGERESEGEGEGRVEGRVEGDEVVLVCGLNAVANAYCLEHWPCRQFEGRIKWLVPALTGCDRMTYISQVI